MVFESFVSGGFISSLQFTFHGYLSKNFNDRQRHKTKIDKKGVQKVCLMYFKVSVPNVSAEKSTLKLGLNTTEVYGCHYKGPKTNLKGYHNSCYF